MLKHSVVSNFLQSYSPLSVGFFKREYWRGLSLPANSGDVGSIPKLEEEMASHSSILA